MQLVQEYTDRVVELLSNSITSDLTTALRLVTEALKNSQHAEKLLELKAITLILVGYNICLIPIQFLIPEV